MKELFLNNVSVVDADATSQNVKDFFSTIGRTLNASLPSTCQPPGGHTIPTNQSSFFLFPVTFVQYERIIRNLKLTKNYISTISIKPFKSVSYYLL